MEKNFEGKQFIIDDGYGLPKIDCMFFPSTQGEVVTLDPIFQVILNNKKKGSIREVIDENKIYTKKYLEKSTIIMCNPNALIY
jgi:hypothetical protein